MNKELKEKILKLITIFFQENDGNRLNRWLALSLINEVKFLMDEIDSEVTEKE